MCASKLLSLHQDIWLCHILPFVGMGNFAFVACVSHQMKDYYTSYCDSVKIRPEVKAEDNSFRRPLKAYLTLSSVQPSPMWHVQNIGTSFKCAKSKSLLHMLASEWHMLASELQILEI